MKPIRLVIAEARTLFRQGLVALLASEADLEIVGEAGHADEARRLCTRVQPDVILLDAALPHGEETDGLAAIAGLRVCCPHAAILVIGEAGEANLPGQLLSEEQMRAAAQAERQRALSLGAAGYARSTIDGSELARLIHTLVSEAAGEPAPEDHAGCRKRPLITERDQAVIELIAQGLSYKEIASRLGISLQTVKTHVGNMLKRLELADRIQLALYALTHPPDRPHP
ncbi:MAG TPA: response regulator transcription factor [Chthonomonadaceae bacterium]|nr:response regulator transcription factor [Chthonomonadaceae bacterium]